VKKILSLKKKEKERIQKVERKRERALFLHWEKRINKKKRNDQRKR
jgi:hypothetical protein